VAEGVGDPSLPSRRAPKDRRMRALTLLTTGALLELGA